jgi:hypothetical protein
VGDLTIEELAKQIAEHVRPAVPIEHALWDVADIANYLRRSPATVRERIVCLPGFPKPFRTPTLREGEQTRGHPTWKAMEVIEWNQQYRDNAQGRPRKAS